MNAGSGISVSGTYPTFTVTNSSPDQTVALTGTGGTTISGTYPNFTINSTDTNTTYTAGTGLTLTSTEFSVTDNGIGALQLNVSGNGTSGQFLASDGDGTFSWQTGGAGGNETLAQTLALGAVTGGTDISVSSGDNIVMAANSTVDGRDLSVDGAKLDGIEASADVTDTANVTAAGAVMDSELTSEASVKALNQGVATTDSPTFAAINVNGLVTSDDFQIDLGTATASAQITTPSALSGFQAFSIKNTSTEGYLSFGTTLGQARIQATGASGSADPLDIDVGGITAIGIADDGAVTMGGDVTLDAGLTGDAILTIRADSDNNNESDHPSVRFKQDGDLVDWRIGLGSTDSDGATHNNDLCFSHLAGSSNGLKYVSQGGTVNTIWHAGNDGSGSGLDADTLDGVQASGFITTSTAQPSQIAIRNGSPTLYLRDTNANSAMLHCNSNIFFVLRGGIDTTTWTTVNGRWPMQLNLSNNDATFGGNVTAYSDARLKENITSIGNSMEMFNQIDAKRYNWIDNGKNDIGFIAQDVKAAGLVEVVKEAEDRDPETGELFDTHLTLDYSRMVSVLWDVVKELKAEVEELKGNA
jgi:hypothetical protein